ncbi:MAG: ABC transporter permease subunit [bacterium]|nr:ABC transporter permease subunit [bacterium]
MYKKRIQTVLIFLFWLTVWQAVSLLLHNPIVLVGPLETLKALQRLVITMEFWLSILSSLARIGSGFLLAFSAGILLAVPACRFGLLRDCLEPLVLLLKSIPVASFVILALIWIGSRNLSIFVSASVVFPLVYTNLLAGLQNTDPKLLEMAEVFRIRLPQRIRYIYLPALLPYLCSATKTALGMAWKSGVAAEVIGVPTPSIGEQLYMAKIYLSTADLFAWTFVIICISLLSEKLFLHLLNRWS